MEGTVMSLIVIVVVMLLFVWMVLDKRMHLDIYKDRLFQIREQWFDLALDENSSLKFDSPTYRRVEWLLCRMLASAALFTVFTIVYLNIRGIVVRDRDSGPGAESTLDNLNQIEDFYTRTKAVAIYRRIPFSMHHYLCGRSRIYLLALYVMTMFQPAPESVRSESLVEEIGRLLGPAPGRHRRTRGVPA